MAIGFTGCGDEKEIADKEEMTTWEYEIKITGDAISIKIYNISGYSRGDITNDDIKESILKEIRYRRSLQALKGGEKAQVRVICSPDDDQKLRELVGNAVKSFLGPFYKIVV